MIAPKIFLALPEHERESIERYCVDNIAPRWRKHIFAISLKSVGVKSPDRHQLTDQAASVFESYRPNHDSVLLAHNEAKIDHLSLAARWEEHSFAPEKFHTVSSQTIRKKIKKLGAMDQAFWQDHAAAQLSHFEGIKTKPQVWMEQFNRLGIGHIGKRLLMQIRTIRFDGGKRPFGVKKHEQLGQSILYSFISDEDPGGSWVSVKDALTHEHRPEAVDCVNWNSITGEISIPDREFDELVLCEDGLWSGSETIKRLNAFRAISLEKRIRLKFAVASDFGLRVVRHKIRELDLSGVLQVDAHDAEIVSFLSSGLPEASINGLGMPSSKYFRSLHDYVVPLAFADERDWPDGRDEAMEVCRSIGYQLVKQWYADAHPGKDSVAAAEKFSLGGGSFASTIFFKKSVPKVCLPLFWLDGQVEIEGTTVEWKPLLVDPRRVRSDELLANDD